MANLNLTEELQLAIHTELRAIRTELRAIRTELPAIRAILHTELPAIQPIRELPAIRPIRTELGAIGPIRRRLIPIRTESGVIQVISSTETELRRTESPTVRTIRELLAIRPIRTESPTVRPIRELLAIRPIRTELRATRPIRIIPLRHTELPAIRPIHTELRAKIASLVEAANMNSANVNARFANIRLLIEQGRCRCGIPASPEDPAAAGPLIKGEAQVAGYKMEQENVEQENKEILLNNGLMNGDNVMLENVDKTGKFSDNVDEDWEIDEMVWMMSRNMISF